MHNEETNRTLNILIISSHKLTSDSFNPNTSLLSSIKSGLKTVSTDNNFSLISKLRIKPPQFSKSPELKNKFLAELASNSTQSLVYKQ